jgi:hypothetical protein
LRNAQEVVYRIASSGYSTYFTDIRSGNNGYPAHGAFDLVTGLGSPRANRIVMAMATFSGAGGNVIKSGGKASVAGSAVASVAVAANQRTLDFPIDAPTALVKVSAPVAALPVDGRGQPETLVPLTVADRTLTTVARSLKANGSAAEEEWDAKLDEL